MNNKYVYYIIIKVTSDKHTKIKERWEKVLFHSLNVCTKCTHTSTIHKTNMHEHIATRAYYTWHQTEQKTLNKKSASINTACNRSQLSKSCTIFWLEAYLTLAIITLNTTKQNNQVKAAVHCYTLLRVQEGEGRGAWWGGRSSWKQKPEDTEEQREWNMMSRVVSVRLGWTCILSTEGF